MAETQKKRPFLWVILILLFVGLLGFGTGGLNGTINSVGTVGDRDITVGEYQRSLNSQLQAISAELGARIGFQQAQASGIDQIVLQQVIMQATLDNEVAGLGVSIGDERVRDEVLRVPAFQGLDGAFNREAYAETLARVGQSEAEFEASIRDDISRSLLQGAVVGGVPVPQSLADAQVAYLGETRDILFAAVTADDLTAPVPGPTDADIDAFYAENGGSYVQPEARDIIYVWLTPSMIQDGLEVDETALRALYDERIVQFIQPERRLVERLAFVDEPTAQAAFDRITGGDIDFDALVAERGLDLADVDLGDVSQDDLRGAGDAVFAATPGDVVGPLNSSLGPALFRVNAVLAAEEIPFEEAQVDLREELATQRAVRVIDQAAEGINDLMAGGASLEDLADRSDLELGRIAFSQDTSDGIAAYDNFRAAATAAEDGAFPQLLQLSDGGIFALRLDGVTPPSQRPLADVRDAVIADWTAQRRQDMVLEQAQATADQITPQSGFDTLGLTAIEVLSLTRGGFVEATPRGFVADVFAMELSGVQVIDGGDQALIVRLDGIAPPDPADPRVVAQLEQLGAEAAGGIAQDMFEAFANTVQNRTDVTINQAAINAVNAQFQ